MQKTEPPAGKPASRFRKQMPMREQKIKYWNQNLRLPRQYTVNTYTPPPFFLREKGKRKEV